jgi:two-component system response regulator
MTMVKRVLFADDSERDTELALEAFAEYRMCNEVIVVRDGVEALDYLYRRGEFAGREEGLPSLVLLDLKMPRLSGIDVLREIKGDPALRALPVVIMTSSREEQDLAACYELGANAYVVKPVKFQSFVEVVRQLGMFWMMVNEPPPAPLMRGQPSE